MTDGHTYGTDDITGYKTIDGIVLGIGRAPACRGGRKAVRSILAGFGDEEFTTAGVKSAMQAHNPEYLQKAQDHWEVWHEFYQVQAKPIKTFAWWFHVNIGNALTGIARDNPDLLIRLTTKQNSRSRWQNVRSDQSFQQAAEEWSQKQKEIDAAAVAREAAVRSSGIDAPDLEVLPEPGIEVAGINLPPPTDPSFTVFVRNGGTYKRTRLRAEDRQAAANEAARSNPSADLIEVFVHEGQLFEYRLVEAL